MILALCLAPLTFAAVVLIVAVVAGLMEMMRAGRGVQ